MTFRVRIRAGGGLVLADYLCPKHGRFEALQARSETDSAPCPTCGASSPWAPTPVAGRVKRGEVVQGKFEPPPNELALDTRALADGMPLSEWRAKRKRINRDHTRKVVRSKTG